MHSVIFYNLSELIIQHNDFISIINVSVVILFLKQQKTP